ncbi:MAG: YbjN domain-containing protein [Corynebacterium sp.]|nr:YbjN domain-containing protein [Corynebacterium sp.]
MDAASINPASPTPVTAERLTTVLTSLGLKSQPADTNPQGVLVGFLDLLLQFTVAGDTLHCAGQWRGEPPEDMVLPLIAGTSAFNTQQIFPTLAVQHTDTSLVVIMTRSADIAFGLTDDQLTTWIASSIHQFGEAGKWLAENFPQAVTWNEGDPQ